MTRSFWIKLVGLVLVMAAVWGSLAAFGIDLRSFRPDRVRTFVLSFGIWAPVMYLFVYAQPIPPLPVTILTLAGGLAFGPLWGTAAAVTGATLRACSQFFVARRLGRKAVRKFFTEGKIASLNRRLGQNSFKSVLLIRLIPNFPYDIQNYALGCSHVRFWPFALATCLGILPTTIALVYFGYSLTTPRQMWKLGVAILFLVILMVVTSRWKRRSSATPLNV